MQQFQIQTRERTHFVAVTDQVQACVEKAALLDGLVTVFIPHTTAGVTINENADPDVVSDMTGVLDRLRPWNDHRYQHAEGNTAAHVKATLTGSSVQIPVQGGRLKLGTWQGVYLCEYDGPRTRQVWIQTSPA